MASEAKSALEAWERSVEQVKLATGALQSALKLMEAATSKVVHDAWDTVCSARAALRSAVEEEASKFSVIEDHKRQTTMDLDDKAREEAAGRGAVRGEGRVHPQEPLRLLPPGAPATPAEEELEDPDRLVDDDDDEAEPGPAGEDLGAEAGADGQPEPGTEANAGDGAPDDEDHGEEPAGAEGEDEKE